MDKGKATIWTWNVINWSWLRDRASSLRHVIFAWCLHLKVHSRLVPQWNYSTTLDSVWVKGDSGNWMTCPRNHSQKILVIQDVWPPSSALSIGAQLILHGYKTVAPPGDQKYKSLHLPYRTFVRRQWGNGYERADIITMIIAQLICICIFSLFWVIS